MIEKMYTPQEIVDLLKMNVATIRDFLRKGIMPHYKPNSKYVISESQLQEFLNKSKNEQ